MDSDPTKNLVDYVNGFGHRLYVAGLLAKENLSSAQRKMKQTYDRGAEGREFSPGNRVLALLPVVGSPFQARYTGPHTIVKQTSEENYLISTPNRRRKTQLCHVNLLKPYFFHRAEQGASDTPFESVQHAALAKKCIRFSVSVCGRG